MIPRADLVAHVGCGDTDNMGRCDKCNAIRSALDATPAAYLVARGKLHARFRDAAEEVFDCAEKLSAVVNSIDGDYCESHTAPAAQIVVERLRKLAAALAAPPAAPPIPASMREHVVGMDRDGNLLVRVSSMNQAGNVDTGVYAFSPPPAAPPADLVAAIKEELQREFDRCAACGHYRCWHLDGRCHWHTREIVGARVPCGCETFAAPTHPPEESNRGR